MTFNTGNQIGSTDARDLSDNAENFDKALNSTAETWTDRLGVTRDSFEGALSKLSFYRVGTFAAGYTLTNMRQTLEYNGHEYSWAGTFPKVVAAGATPATSGGIGAGAWVDRTDFTLKPQVREVLRRSYAEADYNLVDGSFEVGGTLVNANDVLLQERTGKVFTGPAGSVAAGTNPASGGFVDRSFAPNYFRQNAVSAVMRSALDKMRDVVHVADFGAISDGVTDNTAAIQAALDYAYASKSKLQFGPGVYRVMDTLNAMLGDNYSTPGTFMFGAGKGKTVVLLDYSNTTSPKSIVNLVKSPTAAAPIYNFSCHDMSLSGTVADAVSAGVNVSTGVSGLDFRNVEIRTVIAGIWTKYDAWINSFTGMTIKPRDYGIRMDASGTTNWFNGCFVYGSNVTAYKLRGSYSSIGSLAADNCAGIIYDLRYFSGSVGSLGAESPIVGRTPSKLLVIDNGNVNIKHILGFRVCPTDGTPFTGVEVGSGHARIGTLVLDKNNQSDDNLVVTGNVISGYRGSVKLGRVRTPKDSNGVNPGTLSFSNPDPLNTFIQLDMTDGTPVAMRGDSKPFIGIGSSEATALSGITQSLPLRTQQNIYLDAAGGPNGSGVGSNYDSDRDRWKAGATLGSWMMESDPGLRGCAGYAVTIAGVDMSSTVVARIPIVQTAVEYANLPTNDLWEGRRVFVRSVHKWVTYSSYGTAGWYDDAGIKVV